MMTTLDRKYRDGLMMALRMRDVRGDRVGEVLAEVETHVAETGEDPREAFGEPREYAARIAQETGVGRLSPVRFLASPRMLAFLMAALIGSEVLSSAIAADGPTVAFTMSDLVGLPLSLAAVLVGMWLLIASSTVTMNAHRRNWMRVGVLGVFVVGIVGASLVRHLFDDDLPVLKLATWVAYLVAAALLVPVGCMLAWTIKRGWPVDPRSNT